MIWILHSRFTCSLCDYLRANSLIAQVETRRIVVRSKISASAAGTVEVIIFWQNCTDWAFQWVIQIINVYPDTWRYRFFQHKLSCSQAFFFSSFPQFCFWSLANCSLQISFMELIQKFESTLSRAFPSVFVLPAATYSWIQITILQWLAKKWDCVCVCENLLLVMWDTFSSFLRTESMRDDVWSISSPKSPNILNTERGTRSFKQSGKLQCGHFQQKHQTLLWMHFIHIHLGPTLAAQTLGWHHTILSRYFCHDTRFLQY